MMATTASIESSPAPVRVGRIGFVNCFPLYHHFERELAARGLSATVIEGSPATLNEMLASGAIDVALPSSIAYARQAHRLDLLPQVSISSFGAVDSVQLFTRVPLKELRRVAVTAKSATSVCLLRILCEAWGIAPEFAVPRGVMADVLVEYDGLLLIGDEALSVLRAEVYAHHFDLGEEWCRMTGHPMVFAVCAARREFVAARPAAAAAVGAALIASRDECAAHPLETAAAAALRYDFSQKYLLEYFDKLKFGFTPEYRAGLEEFYRRAAAIGELEIVPDLPAFSAPEASAAPSAGGGGAGAANDLVACSPDGLFPGPGAFSGLTWREPQDHDAGVIAAAIEEWWPGRHIIHGVCPQLLEHLGDTSLIVEDHGELVGFLVGYLSQRVLDAGYVHYAGVRPDCRGRGVGREMYRRFAAATRERGRTRVVAETGAWNSGSLAFHARVGFTLEASAEIIDGLPVHRDVAGLGCDYVRMVLRLDRWGA